MLLLKNCFLIEPEEIWLKVMYNNVINSLTTTKHLTSFMCAHLIFCLFILYKYVLTVFSFSVCHLQHPLRCYQIAMSAEKCYAQCNL